VNREQRYPDGIMIVTFFNRSFMMNPQGPWTRSVFLGRTGSKGRPQTGSVSIAFVIITLVVILLAMIMYPQVSALRNRFRIRAGIHDLQDEAAEIRRRAAFELGMIGDPRAIEPLIVALQDEVSDVRDSAATALGKIGDPRAIEPLIVALQDEDKLVRNRAARALRHIGAPAIEPLTVALEDADPHVRALITETLGKIRDMKPGTMTPPFPKTITPSGSTPFVSHTSVQPRAPSTPPPHSWRGMSTVVTSVPAPVRLGPGETHPVDTVYHGKNTMVRVLGQTPDGRWVAVVGPKKAVGWMAVDALTIPASSVNIPIIDDVERWKISGKAVLSSGEPVEGIAIAISSSSPDAAGSSIVKEGESGVDDLKPSEVMGRQCGKNHQRLASLNCQLQMGIGKFT
jgi:hypothetical protein